MAKALFGHTSPRPDFRLLDEVGRLRRRVQELERELSATRAENRQLAASLGVSDLALDDPRLGDEALIGLSRLEPASI